MNTIQAEWLSFAEKVVPANASKVQLTEVRRAFYAGAKAMMAINRRLGEPDISEDAGVAILTAIEMELNEFLQQVLKGDA